MEHNCKERKSCKLWLRIDVIALSIKYSNLYIFLIFDIMSLNIYILPVTKFYKYRNIYIITKIINK